MIDKLADEWMDEQEAKGRNFLNQEIALVREVWLIATKDILSRIKTIGDTGYGDIVISKEQLEELELNR